MGDDGKPGAPGDAEVTHEVIFDLLTDGGEVKGIFPFSAQNNDKGEVSLYINADYIRSGTLSGVTIESTDGKNSTVIEDGVISFSPNGNGTKMQLGYSNNTDAEPFMRFGQGTGAGSVEIDGVQFVKGTGMLWKYDDAFAIGLVGSDGKHQLMYFRDSDSGSHIDFHSDVIIDFSQCAEVILPLDVETKALAVFG